MNVEYRRQGNFEAGLQEKPNQAVPEKVNWQLVLNLGKFTWEFVDQANRAKQKDSTSKVKDEHPNDGTRIDDEKHRLVSTLPEADIEPVFLR